MNSKIVVFALAVSFCILSTSARPGLDHAEELISESEVGPGPRYKRLTCDLLSASVKGFEANHSLCAAHCLVQKYKGGYCKDGVCHCRR